MHVKRARVINCPILGPLVCPLVLWTLFSQMYGVTSVGRHNYYVSFIVDNSKFTWIYLLLHNSEVFQCFHDFHNLVENQFNRKILAIQADWGGGIRP